MSKELSQFDQLKADITLYVYPVQQMVVTDVVSGQKALEAVKVVKGLLKRLDEKRDDLVRPLNDQVKVINNYAKGIEGPLKEAERHIKAQLVAFEEIQERARQVERRKEEERQREIQRAAELERRRIESEMKAKADAERAALAEKTEAADLFGDDETDVDRERQELELRQARELAERQAQLDREAAVRASEAKARQYDIEATRLKNTKKAWKVEVIDIEKVPAQYVIKTLNNQMALAAARGGITDIPGLRLYQETQLTIGANTSLKSPAELSDQSSFENYDKTKI